MSEPWIDYTSLSKTNKEFYDLRLRDGTEVPACWPDGEHFVHFHTHEFYADYRILQIRRGKNPWEPLVKQLQKTTSLIPCIPGNGWRERGKTN